MAPPAVFGTTGRIALLSPMSPRNRADAPSRPGPRAMSSQSAADAPATLYVAWVRPDGPTAKNRGASPESLCVYQTPSRLLAARPLDSVISGSWNVNSSSGAAWPATAADGTADVQSTS